MKIGRHRIQTILLIAILTALLLWGENYYISNMRTALWNQSVADILEVTAQGCHAFEVYLGKDLDMLNNLTQRFSQVESGDTESIKNNLSLFAEVDVFYSVADLEQGILYSNYLSEPERLNDSDLAALRNLSGQGLLEPYLNTYTGEETLGYYTRFTFADGVEGLVRKGQLISQISSEFSLSFYDGAGFSYLVNGQGDILIQADGQGDSYIDRNVLEILEDENDPEEIAALQKSLASNTEQGVVRLQLNGEEYIYVYAPLRYTLGWDLVAIIPGNVILEYTNRLLQTSQFIVFVVGVSLLLLLCFLVVTHRNYRALVKKDQEIQYQRQLFDMLANNTNNVYLMLNRDDLGVEYVSPNVDRVLGISQEAVRADIHVLSGAVYEGGEPELTEDRLLGMAPDESVTMESERVHRTTGERHWFEETVYRTIVEDSDRFIAVLADRTQERQNRTTMEAALKIAQAANQSKSTFLSSMSHDIRTPMNAIVGLATLLQRDADNPERVREHTRKIAAASQHLLGLINDVLDMSKIESGKTTLNMGELSLPDLMEKILTIIRPQTKARHQTFEVSLQGITSEHLLGDELRISQVLLNILSNAVKYTPEYGKIEMQICQLPQVTKNFDRLRFVIRDNGIGMSPEYLDVIFLPFTREENQNVRGIQGTGLGMAITKNLVDLMGGSISVESALGEGSTFTVDLELRIQEQDTDPDFWRKHGVTHVLVVDDEKVICESVLSAMEETGIRMDYALSGMDAVEMVRAAMEQKKEYDLILLDWKMPQMSGIETAERIRSIIPARVPILVMTAYDWSDISDRAVKAGIDGFLAKPFFLSNLRCTIGNLQQERQKAGQPEGEAVREETNVLAGMHFLAAEDNALNAEILAELLDMDGATCEIAEDGQKALEAFQASKPGTYRMILMDVQMPVMNGYEATRAIRACDHPDARTIPIIAMTANAFAEDIRAALDAGMTAHVAKPVDMDRLKDVVQEILSGQLPQM